MTRSRRSRVRAWLGRRRQARLRKEFGALIAEVSAILSHHDPIGIQTADNLFEYDLEAGTILPRLRTCASAEDAQRVVHEEFAHWFGPEQAGPPGHYLEIGAEVWQAWQRFISQTI